jgi:16S rRNA (uracil1498-N3)-methyltransferase
LFIGPEGGFSQDEVQFFQSEQVESVTLGKRILRMETAAIAAVAIAMTACGDV